MGSAVGCPECGAEIVSHTSSIDSEPSRALANSPSPKPTKPIRPRRLLVICAILLIPVACYSLYSRYLRKAHDSSSLPHYTEIRSLAISADGRRLAASGLIDRVERGKPGPRQTSVRVWEIGPGEPRFVREIRPRSERAPDASDGVVALSPDGTILAAIEVRGSPSDAKLLVVFWSIETGKVLGEVEPPFQNPPFQAADLPSKMTFTDEGRSVVFAWKAGVTRVGVHDGVVAQKRPIDSPGYGAVYIPGLKRIVELRRSKDTGNTELARWNPDSDDPPKVVNLGSLTTFFNRFAISRDGKTLAIFHYGTSAEKKSVSLVSFFDPDTGKRISKVDVSGFGGYPNLELSPDGRLLALANGPNEKKAVTVAIYRTSDGKRLHESVHEHDKDALLQIPFPTFLPDGSALIYVRQPKTITRMDTQTGLETDY